MILLIRCDKEPRSYSNWETTFNSEISDVNEVFISNGISTILLYKRTLPDEVKKSTIHKRGTKNLSLLNFSLLKEECILFYHADVITNEDSESIEKLFHYCHNNNKHLVLQFSLETQHLINHICTGSEIYIQRDELKTFLTRLDRDLKLNKLLK